MATRRVLLLDADGLTAYRCHAGSVHDEGRFAVGDAATFADYLKRYPDCVYSLLADVADESFHLEHIPHVAGRNRRALIARKLDRHCYGAPLAAALPQGRLADGRRDERMLFAALTRPQDIEPWLQLLTQARAALAGVYAMPQVVASLAPGRAGRLLLMTLTRSGLRQTLIEDGRLRFSRLTALANDEIEETAAACAHEAATMHRYLCGQRLVERGTPLSALVLAHPAQVERFRAHCRDTDELRFEYVDLAAAVRHFGLATTLPDSRGDALFVHRLNTDRPHQQFAPAALRHSFRLRQICRTADATGLTALVAALLFAAVQVPGALRTREHTEQLRARNAVDERSWRDMQQALPPGTPPADQLRELVARYEQILRTSPGPTPLFGRLSAAMDDFPQIELRRLDWRVDQGFEHAAETFAIVDVHGTLPPGTDRRNQLAIVGRFAARLRAEPALRASVQKLPVEMDSSQSIRSADSPQESAAFVLRVAQQL